MRKYTKRRLVANVGKNDADYHVFPTINGKQVLCEFYKTWQSMIVRCYSEARESKHACYATSTVCDEWHSFMNFRSWMMFQDWRGKQLDKDIIDPGNKIYSPEKCAFVGRHINSLFTGSNRSISDKRRGACYEKIRKKFMAQCYDGFDNQIKLGEFDTPDEAHNAYVKFKVKVIQRIIKNEPDQRISDGLLKHIEILKGTDNVYD